MLASKVLIIVFILAINFYIGSTLERISRAQYLNPSLLDNIIGYIPFINVCRAVRLGSTNGVIQIGVREIKVIVLDALAVVSVLMWFIAPSYSPRFLLIGLSSTIMVIGMHSLYSKVGLKMSSIGYIAPIVIMLLSNVWYALYELFIFICSIKLGKFVKAVIEINTKTKEQSTYSLINSWKEENDLCTQDLEQWDNPED